MYVFPGSETIPFHLVWISLAIVYGFQPWRNLFMVPTLVIVIFSTGAALWHHAQAGLIGLEETAEIPLMAALFLVMVWHVRRRQAALRRVETLAGVERRRAASQQLFIRRGSHELRTPITVARGYTELIRSANPAIRADTEIILDELAKLERITNRLLTLMQVDVAAPPSIVDFDRMLPRIVKRWAPTANRDWQVDSTVGLGLANVERFETALDCLLENAVKFTEDNDTIRVRAWREAGSICLQVSDTGMGVAADDLPFIFDNFAIGTDVGKRGGTGLGLPIVRAIVEARGGTIDVTSTLGDGATFLVNVPAWVPEADGPNLRLSNREGHRYGMNQSPALAGDLDAEGAAHG